MFEEITRKIKIDKIIELSTGKVAWQADGAVMARKWDSIILCTVVCAKEVKEGIVFSLLPWIIKK